MIKLNSNENLQEIYIEWHTPLQQQQLQTANCNNSNCTSNPVPIINPSPKGLVGLHVVSLQWLPSTKPNTTKAKPNQPSNQTTPNQAQPTPTPTPTGTPHSTLPTHHTTAHNNVSLRSWASRKNHATNQQQTYCTILQRHFRAAQKLR